jgi:hypothetical protein
MMIEQVVKYLKDTLNVTVRLRPWEEGSHHLPLFLQDNYVYYLAKIQGLEFLLMVDSSEGERPPSIVGKHLKQVEIKWGGDVVYVREQVSAYIRKRLIEAGIQFIVPGNQLYLPVLAVDLREYFRRKRKRVQKFSPATQALVLFWIYNQGGIGRERTTPTQMAHILGYTKMTMSRAFKEVDGVLDEILTVDETVNENKNTVSGRELLEKLQPYWRNPVNRRHYLPKNDFDRGIGLRAGLAALSAYSMLAEPAEEIYAVSQSEWKDLVKKRNILVLDHPDTQTMKVEVWSYSPKLFAQQGLKGAVDPLSLYFTLKENHDERIEMALDELIRGIQW